MKKNTNYNQSKYSEREMVIEFCKRLEAERVSFAVEVPFFHRSIDLVYLDRKNNFYVLEFKMFDWKKAIKQAQECVLGADYIYICIPKTIYNPDIVKTLRKTHCGLITFDMQTSAVKEVRKSRKNMSSFKHAVEVLKEGFEYSVRNNNYQQLLAI